MEEKASKCHTIQYLNKEDIIIYNFVSSCEMINGSIFSENEFQSHKVCRITFSFFLAHIYAQRNDENSLKRMVIELTNVRKFTHILLAHISYIHGPIINVQTDLSVGSYSY